ncbi:hypothetical protein PHSY_006581 [Pseudozyma hubeiensis SY62]|uniref:Uncharacterized protein n=1 Tax=Pseudozyma hubeiensis (strain SY62) TaxID=1305764 RepID=R9PCA4_PSEHS|nr:hypothetical protein PHSY_006581 [Pseudozyma hubeiensis SY62]GAC98984.1 hypothetical protein PHSY_006581 [Pseudozyma hubeiensis SY62]
MSSVRTDPAIILPISDLSLSRDVTLKLRLAGIVTAVSPTNSSLILLSDPFPASTSSAGSILVDLSLCTDHPDDTARLWSKNAQLVPPELKSTLMVIGHLTKRSTPVDTGFLAESKPDWSRVQLKDAVQLGNGKEWTEVNRWFVVEALLVKPLGREFDLRLWNETARLRSIHLWTMYERDQQAKRDLIACTTTHVSPVQDRKGKRKAIVID